MAREHLCPFCRIHGASLIGIFFKSKAIDYVAPSEARELAALVLFCNRECCMNYNVLQANRVPDLYCPACRTWSLKCDHAAQEGWGFACQNCDFMFGIIN